MAQEAKLLMKHVSLLLLKLALRVAVAAVQLPPLLLLLLLPNQVFFPLSLMMLALRHLPHLVVASLCGLLCGSHATELSPSG
jgi:hypothetical protein